MLTVWPESLYLGLLQAALQQCILATIQAYRSDNPMAHGKSAHHGTEIESVPGELAQALVLVLNVSVFTVSSLLSIY